MFCLSCGGVGADWWCSLGNRSTGTDGIVGSSCLGRDGRWRCEEWFWTLDWDLALEHVFLFLLHNIHFQQVNETGHLFSIHANNAAELTRTALPLDIHVLMQWPRQQGVLTRHREYHSQGYLYQRRHCLIIPCLPVVGKSASRNQSIPVPVSCIVYLISITY